MVENCCEPEEGSNFPDKSKKAAAALFKTGLTRYKQCKGQEAQRWEKKNMNARERFVIHYPAIQPRGYKHCRHCWTVCSVPSICYLSHFIGTAVDYSLR